MKKAVAEKPKKADAKELEAQRLLDEQKQIELDRIQQIQELKKYTAETLSTGLRCVLTEYCVTEAWGHLDPKQFIYSFLEQFMIREGIRDNFKKYELHIISEFHLYNLLFCKQELQLNNYNTMVLLNIMGDLISDNNRKFIDRKLKIEDFLVRKTIEQNKNISKQSPVKESKDAKEKQSQLDEEKMQQLEAEEKLKVAQQEIANKLAKIKPKTLESDFLHLKEVLMNHFVENPPLSLRIFDQCLLERIVSYLQHGYFEHYDLYQFCFQYERKVKGETIQVFVDAPLESEPLCQATYMGSDTLEVNVGSEDYRKEIEAKMEQMNKVRQKEMDEEQAREEKAREEEADRLDVGTQEMLKERVRQAEIFMAKQLQERAKMLDEKLEAILTNKKK